MEYLTIPALKILINNLIQYDYQIIHTKCYPGRLWKQLIRDYPLIPFQKPFPKVRAFGLHSSIILIEKSSVISIETNYVEVWYTESSEVQ